MKELQDKLHHFTIRQDRRIQRRALGKAWLTAAVFTGVLVCLVSFLTAYL